MMRFGRTSQDKDRIHMQSKQTSPIGLQIMIMHIRKGALILKSLALVEVATSLAPGKRQFHTFQRTSALFASSSPLGGDFAGLDATFNPSDGTLIPIPVHLVEESLVEWGQVPKCLETLVSEDVADDGATVERNSIVVLPATGCAVDNLETMKKSEKLDMSEKDISGDVIGVQYESGDKCYRLESIFGMDDGYRMRVVLDLIPSEEDMLTPKSPIHLHYERKTSEESTGGTRADGGGLDGRTVSGLLGPELSKSKSFVEDEPREKTHRSEGIRHIGLPGNVTISYGSPISNSWTCDICHELDDRIRGVTSAAIQFGGGDLDFDVEAWEGED